MASTFAFYKQLLAPTGVERCVAAYLTHPPGVPAAAPDLVLVKEAQLELWVPRLGGHGGEADGTEADGGGARGGKAESSPKLELVGEFPLQGIVRSVAVLNHRYAQACHRAEGFLCDDPWPRLLE
jgi:hypothetical protein